MPDTDDFPPELDDAFVRRLVTLAHYELYQLGALAADPCDVAAQAMMEIYGKWTRGELRLTSAQELLAGLGWTIVKFRAKDAARRVRGSHERAVRHVDQELVGTTAALDEFKPLYVRTSTRLGRIDARERVTQILNFLVERERDEAARGDYEVFVLHHVQGLSYEDIAARRGQGESAEAIRSRIRRTHDVIRERFPPPKPLRDA
jgi:DNA-directed RNA polymerase specialized sigma24 family protein